MRAILVGYYGFGNSGDEALLLTLLQQMPARVTPVVLSNTPERTEKLYGIEARDRWDLWGLHQLLRGADAFIWGGGSLMQDRSSWRNPLYYGGLMRWAQWYGLKTIAWGQGIGPLDQRWTSWLTRQCLSRCTAVSVRDQVSSTLLQQWGIDCVLAPDPVWSLAALPYEGKWKTPAIAIVLRQHPLLTPNRLSVIQRALERCQAGTAAHLVFMPFQAADIEVATSLQAKLACPSQVVRIEDPRQLKSAFASVGLTIAMRLHGAILAAAAGGPVFGLSYDPKVTQLCEAEQIPFYELAELPQDAETLANAWVKQYGRSGLSAEHLQRLHDRAGRHAEVLKQGLGI